MHRLTLENDNKNPSYSVGKDENSKSPRHSFEALAHSKYPTVEEKDRKFYCGNSNQIKNADCKNKLEDHSEKMVVLKGYIVNYLDIDNWVLKKNYVSPGTIVYAYVS